MKRYKVKTKIYKDGSNKTELYYNVLFGFQYRRGFPFRNGLFGFIEKFFTFILLVMLNRGVWRLNSSYTNSFSAKDDIEIFNREWAKKKERHYQEIESNKIVRRYTYYK